MVCTLSFAAVLGIILVTTDISGGHGSPAGTAAGPTAGTQAGSGISPDAASTVRGWYVKGGGSHLTTLARDVTSVQDDQSAGDTTSMQNDCGTLLSDVQAAQIYPSIAEPQTDSHWSKALDQLGQAAADCRDGTTDGDAGLIAKSGRELTAASTELDLVTNLVNSLAGG
ncbi:hypothetical protein [Actinacidiphila sp. ITFR-21]|uniref:hypothetical protein n=1 Tax=Actinacidiphila sp. ITFR-21 TaxID=3075199 RepID=UPI002889D6B3|nr:hypothetical protein [Streptomyces sp. ITFR-21]WNI14107.1 hypothetical protein RLT57_00245 [Streptomyces sp. ITFR-21]